MKAIWNDTVIAESDDTVVVEGNHYFPSNSIKSEYFHKTETTTMCPWKGMASYYSVTIDEKTNISHKINIRLHTYGYLAPLCATSVS